VEEQSSGSTYSHNTWEAYPRRAERTSRLHVTASIGYAETDVSLFRQCAPYAGEIILHQLTRSIPVPYWRENQDSNAAVYLFDCPTIATSLFFRNQLSHGCVGKREWDKA
jgi:hypothetical protein